MDGLKITWDRSKNTANKWKHGVSFEEAQTVFYDEFARLIPDPDHSGEEDRYILLDMSSRLRLLIVCHCYREANDTIRIISARKANRSEQKQYEGFGHERKLRFFEIKAQSLRKAPEKADHHPHR